MTLKKEAKVLIITILIIYAVIIALFFTKPPSDGYNFIVRLCALLGLASLFIATIMTPFMVQLYKILGKPFVKIHHIFSILGLVLITIHPIAFALYKMDLLVFIPKFDSWIIFWELAGRPALILIYIAVIAGILNTTFKKIPKYWRLIHGLNYIALVFGVVHGILIGTDFKNIIILIIYVSMLIISFVVLFLKRYQKYKRLKAKKKRETIKNTT
ncbi:MAG: hypothetical protein ACFFA6_10885 [Promethearchaeota archaeon]